MRQRALPCAGALLQRCLQGSGLGAAPPGAVHRWQGPSAAVGEAHGGLEVSSLMVPTQTTFGISVKTAQGGFALGGNAWFTTQDAGIRKRFKSEYTDKGR